MPRTPRWVTAQGDAGGARPVARRRAAGKGVPAARTGRGSSAWKMACASGRRSSGQRNLGSDSHGGKLVRTQWAAGPGLRCWDASVPSALQTSLSERSPQPGVGWSVFQCNPLPSIRVRGTSQTTWLVLLGMGLFLTRSSCLQRSLFYKGGTSLKLSENASLPAPST